MTTTERRIALLLPGQGSQHPGMAVELYGQEPTFTRVMDEFFASLGPEGTRLRADWLAEDPVVPVDDVSRAQPLLFAIGYAIGMTLRAHGVSPDVLLGHSIGELAAAALADVFDLACAARLLCARSEVMAGVQAGGMSAVSARPEDLVPFLTGDVVIGALNAPRQTVLAGPEPDLSTVENSVRGAGMLCIRVGALQPFHSTVLAQAARRFAEVFAGLTLRAPRIPIRSTRTGLEVTDAQATDPAFWALQLAEPVLFWPALDGLLSGPGHLLVETGPGQGLATLARRHPAVRCGRSSVLAMLPRSATGTARHWNAALTTLT